MAQLLVLASQQRRQVLRLVKKFFTAATHPINLAVFRVVVFLTILITLTISNGAPDSTSSGVGIIVRFSHFPADLQVVHRHLEWLVAHLPINETLAKVSCTLLLICCFTAIIGLFSRTSAALAVILGFYALGIPQYFGKVVHYHHLLWFAAILAASRCGDFFSCDAISAAWKRADRGVIEPPGSSRAYALPLRFVWLLIGIIYFFPGFWKLWSAGFDWALSDNLKFRLYSHWLGFNWMPFFRVDQYPFLYKLSALGSLGFELSFIFLIFLPRLRILTALAGLLFHNMTGLLLRIYFWHLQTCYVALFDWNAIFHRIGRWLYPEEMYVIYDGNCKLCRRTIASLRVFDIFGRLTYVNALDEKALANHDLRWLDSTALLTDMHAVVQRKTWIGFLSYRALAARIPILWPVLPLLYVWPIPKIGDRIYRYVADSRTCSVANVPPETGGYKHKSQPRLNAVAAVGIFLLLVNTLFGTMKVVESWPFACYPKFTGILGPTTRSAEMVPLSSTGETISWNAQALKQIFASVRFKKMLLDSFSEQDPIQCRTRLAAFWQQMVRNDSSLQQAASVRFYKVTLLTIPERQKENPLHQELIYELRL